MAGLIRYGSEDAVVSRMPSPSIWSDCRVSTFLENPQVGAHMFDDFRNSVVLSSDSTATDFNAGVGHVGGDANWYVFAESDKVEDVAVQADDEGVLLIQTDGTDEDVYAITTGNNVAGVWKAPSAGNPKGYWFEARIKVNTVTDGDIGLFVGLAEPGEAANGLGVFAGDAAALAADKTYVGFAILEGDGNDLCIVYDENDSGTASKTTGKITLVANTWVRVGFRVKSGYVRFYQDGEDLGDDVAIDIRQANVNWPSAHDLDAIVSLVDATNGANGDGVYIDWVRVAMEY